MLFGKKSPAAQRLNISSPHSDPFSPMLCHRCVIILLVLCIIGAIGCRVWLEPFVGKDIYFLPGIRGPNDEAFWTFWTYIIILQVMIPLSLYVTIELCKILQVFHIHNNSDLFDIHTNKRTECRAMNITEELGQVQHIFSDKTGTLTENRMLFRKCTVNGADYNHTPSELEKAYLKPGVPAPPIMVNSQLTDDMVATFFDDSYTMQARRIQEFFLVLSICNTVIVSAAPHYDMMNASGMIETPHSHSKTTHNNSSNGIAKGNDFAALFAVSLFKRFHFLLTEQYTVRIMYDKAICTESRALTPSTPPTTLSVKQNHVPSLSPINSSTESTPTSDSPPMKLKASNNDFLRGSKAKSILSSILNNKTGKRCVDDSFRFRKQTNQCSN